MKCGVVVFPGSNCDHDCFHILKHVFRLDTEWIWHKGDVDLSRFDLIVLPGGYSYGDYLRAGAIAQFSKVMKEVVRFAGSGKMVLGICNGFQILVESVEIEIQFRREQTIPSCESGPALFLVHLRRTEACVCLYTQNRHKFTKKTGAELSRPSPEVDSPSRSKGMVKKKNNCV